MLFSRCNVFIISVLIGMVGTAAAKPAVHHHAKQVRAGATGYCSLKKQHPTWIAASKKAYKRWGVPVPVQLAIIREESNFKAGAQNTHSTAYGYAQVVNPTWRIYLKKRGAYHNRANFVAATDFIGWYGNALHQRLHIPKTNAYKLYLAYHEGEGGYHKATRHPGAAVHHLAHHVAHYAQVYKAQMQACCATQSV